MSSSATIRCVEVKEPATTNGVLANFASFKGTNGSYPEGGLAQGRDGHFYGTTSDGGPNESRHGSIFRIRMPNLETSFRGISCSHADGGAVVPTKAPDLQIFGGHVSSASVRLG
jgi:uncharacterized repeat protein (TIGR03803 family)